MTISRARFGGTGSTRTPSRSSVSGTHRTLHWVPSTKSFVHSWRQSPKGRELPERRCHIPAAIPEVRAREGGRDVAEPDKPCLVRECRAHGLATSPSKALHSSPAGESLTDRLVRAQKLRFWLIEQGGRIGAAASESDVTASQMAAGRLGRSLSIGDARALGAAERAGLPLLTRDRQLRGTAQAFGLLVEGY